MYAASSKSSQVFFVIRGKHSLDNKHENRFNITKNYIKIIGSKWNIPASVLQVSFKLFDISAFASRKWSFKKDGYTSALPREIINKTVIA